MVNRIQEILNHFNLTAARLADQLEIPRSTISHILSERNKPSLEFIQKVLDKYPQININWLLKGEGTIVDKNPDLFSLEYVAEKTIEKTTDQTEAEYENLDKEKKDVNHIKKPENTGETTKKNTLRGKGKKIIKLIALYEDHSFDEFYPSSE